ncbi:MAG: class II aldolase/adducin family protein [Nitrospira sp.]|nr:class II aldolase/adducin family protein [Nitrospira sp.]
MTRPLPTEAQVRVDLAAAHRLAALNGWDDTIYTHISAAVPGDDGAYLIGEFGLGFDEIRASNLVKVDIAGKVLDGSGRKVNPTGFTIHGAVHRARPDAACVMHLHTEAGVALSMLDEGLLPVSQWAMRLVGRLGRHDFEGLALGAQEQQRLVANLGALDGLILRHHGTLTVGRTVAEAYMLTYLLERAAGAQLRAMAATGGRLAPLGRAVAERAQRQWLGDGSEWDGDLEWPHLLRRLDRIAPDYKD